MVRITLHPKKDCLQLCHGIKFLPLIKLMQFEEWLIFIKKKILSCPELVVKTKYIDTLIKLLLTYFYLLWNSKVR